MKKNQLSVKCEHCGGTYTVKASCIGSTRFCSRSCKAQSNSIAFAGRAMPASCKKEKPGPHTRLRLAKKCGHLTRSGRDYCPPCRVKFYSEKTSKNCEACGTPFLVSRSQAKKYKCCSMECRNSQMAKRQKGSNSHLWKGGICSENRLLRNSAKYDSWRSAVFARDEYTCQDCGCRGGKLTADHIKAWSLYPALRFDISNGRTLCRPCHQKTDTFGHRALAAIKALEVNGKLQYRLL